MPEQRGGLSNVFDPFRQQAHYASTSGIHCNWIVPENENPGRFRRTLNRARCLPFR